MCGFLFLILIILYSEKHFSTLNNKPFWRLIDFGVLRWFYCKQNQREYRLKLQYLSLTVIEIYLYPVICRFKFSTNATAKLIQKGHVWSMNFDDEHVICHMYPRSGSINLLSIVRVKCYAWMKNIIHKLNGKMK